MDVTLGPREKILAGIDVESARGLEIGPLYNPRLLKSEANISYLDHVSTEELRAKYEANPDAAPHLDRLVEVDYVCRPPATIVDAVGDDAPFDFVIASHVIEHIPDPVGWLQEVGRILEPGGLLKLVVPDKRFCFDVNRGLTTMADLVDGHLRGLRMPSFRQMYDMAANFLPVDAQELWAGKDVSRERRPDVEDPDRFAYDFCLEQQRTGAYEDVHCSTFTPESFVDLIQRLQVLGLVPFVVESVCPTPPNDHEFFVTLRKADEAELSEHKKRPPVIENRAPAPPALPAGHVEMPISALEHRMIVAKRALAAQVRRLRARIN